MLDIYRAVYNNHHYLIGIALSNLAGVYVGRKDYARAAPRAGDRCFPDTQF